MKIARIIAMLLLIATCLTMVVACDNGDEGNTPAETTKKPTVTTKPNQGEQPNIVQPGVHVHVDHNVEEANFDTDFTFLAWEQSIDEYDFPDGLPADADDVQTELYNRNRNVEEYLGITIKYNQIPGGSSSVDDFVDVAYTSISGNSHAYDAVAAYTRCGGVLATRGVYVDLLKVDHIDTDMPWWPVEITSVNTVADKLYFATGDIATSLIYQMHFLIANQEYAKDLGVSIDELQSLALSGNGVKGGWTLDKLFDVTAKGYKEADGKSGKTAGDRFGLYLCWHNKFDLFYMGAGLTYVNPDDENGLITSPDFTGSKSRDILGRFAEAATTNDSYWISSTTSTGFRLQDGMSLMYAIEGTQLATTLRDATFTYRILPAPKYDGNQIDYYTSVGFPHSLYSIPTDANNRDMSGAVLEVMGAESYNYVTPTLFGKVFLYKLTNSGTDTAILQMIRDRTTFDVGRTFFQELGADNSSPVRLWRNRLYGFSDKIKGDYNEYHEGWDIILKGIYENLDKYGE